MSKFDFTAIDLETAIPENIGRASRANSLPFKDWYTQAAPHALKGGQPHLFVPRSYWVEERNVAEEKLTPGYQKGKLRFQFNEWAKDADPKGELELVLVDREKGNPVTKEAGLSAWLRKKAA